MNRYIHTFAIMLAALMAVGTAKAQAQAQSTGVVVHGNVYGGGNLADVQTNTEVNICVSYNETTTQYEPVSAEGVTINGNVYGGGRGKADNFTCDKAMVGIVDQGVTGTGEEGNPYVLQEGGTTVRIGNGTVKGDVFGGGEVGRVERNTIVTIGTETGASAPVIEGHVFGAGKGLETHGYSALVRGNCEVIIQGDAEVWQNVHGGGEKASVGRYLVATTQALADEYHVAMGMPCLLKAGGKCTVTIQGTATIGKDAGTGDVFGAGQGITPVYNNTPESNSRSKRMVYYDSDTHPEGGDWEYYESGSPYVWEYFSDEAAYLLYVETLARASETDVNIGGDATIKGTVYGGSESGFVYYGTDVDITGGTINGDAFGGGKGLSTFAEAGRVRRNTNLTISDGAVNGNVYGGGSLGDVGTIDKTNKNDEGELTYNYFWKQSNGTTANDAQHNTNATATNTGICTVEITGGTIGTSGTVSSDHGNVFGAGKGTDITWWCEKAIAYATSVSVSGGTVNGNVYGGGQVGRVEDDAKVVIGEEDATGDAAPTITGSVFGAGAGLKTHGYSALVRGNAAVTVQGTAQVGGSVYGGGETASVGRFTVVGGLPKHPDSGGYCTVTIKDNAKIGTSGTGHNVYGACKGVTPAYNNTVDDPDRSKSMQLIKNKPKDDSLWSLYQDEYGNEDSRFIWRYYASEDDYKDFLQTLALTSHPTVTIAENAEVHGSVFGGGERGLTLGNVAVNINGGTIEQDVYGGGALANSNAGNWDADGYTEVTGLTANESSVTDLYTLSGTTYTKITDEAATADGVTTYYSKGKWKDDDLYTTTVNLLGGLVKGDAYGGGLGQKTGFNSATSNIEATVWGDINVYLGGASASATAFDITHYSDEGHTDVVKSGRIFGCNNLLGSPQGNVTVTVYKTVAGNTSRTTAEAKANNKTLRESHPNGYESVEGYVTPTYEVAAVYGGGNLAPFTTAGKKAHVVIYGCDDTSIQTVYGGGNAAPVPETQVDVYATYEIENLFGGGNGKDKYKNDSGWQTNPGADINGNANTIIYGGTVHEAYGGSNEKGTIHGDVAIDVSESTGDESCLLDVAKLVGAGKNADVNGDLIMVMGCKPLAKIPLLFAGADNANVYGDVELTITSGNFGQVFGGNNAGGAIYGHIKLNIEETGDCETPITIDSLYLGGNQAAYSVYGYKTEEDKLVPQSADELRAAIAADNEGKTDEELAALFNSAKQEDPELNIISCTYIGQVFGGGYGTGAYMYADPKVNINMIKGTFADDNAKGVPAKMTELGLDADNNPNHLGIIGTVYGGGNAADVEGNTTVNIGTASTVQTHLAYTGSEYTMSEAQNVLGAYIVGNVFGGGKGEAKMKEGTDGEAFLCAKAMVNGDEGTHVNIGNGFVRGNVYGGGEVGRVEHNTAVTIGLESGASTPVVKGNVFGAGAGTNTHGYSALVRGNSTVIVQADSKVLGSVYGGGEKASVGKYKVVDGLPVALAPDNEHPNSGYCYVTIRGNAEIGPDDMEMTKTGGPSDAGHVFGAGKGVLPYEGYEAGEKPQHMNGTQHLVGGVWDNKSWDDQLLEYPAYDSSQKLDVNYAKFIKSLALATQTVVTIEGNAFVKGSVYGGSENGYVQQNTTVNIQGDCQIGNGYVQMDDDGNYLNKLATPLTPLAVNRRYTSTEWGQGKLILDNNDRLELRNLVGSTYYQSSLPECASWLYGQAADAADRYAPYDREANATGNLGQYADGSTTEGGRAVGDDGHTFYGNVFGGGSGYYPYKPGRWFEDAGAVYGNTEVNITGGHILTNVYGGNEMTNVSGTCTVNFGGTATLGVPRTLKQIDAHPLTCYLFGAGKGDQRVFFNKSTNVKDVVVSITGGRIYGSVFGGGEDGHVQRDVKMTIGNNDQSGPTIGTLGTSYVDGNVFGGGRGFGGDAYTAGNVAGSVKMEIKGGSILGSIYGGGRLGSVGYGLFDATNTDNYGVLQDDDKDDEGNTTNFFKEGSVGLGRGHIDITISGGTIGNTHEYIVPNATNIAAAGISVTDISKWTTDNEWKKWKTYHNIPKTEFDTATGRLTHTKGGNVFAGGMGRFYQLDGTTPISVIDWWKLGSVKSTKLTITGGNIKSNVYGGGEQGWTSDTHTATIDGAEKAVSTEISITGGTIGTEVAEAVTTGTGSEATTSNIVRYTFGSVFGGGYGSSIEKLMAGSKETNPKFQAGRVKYSTKVDISGDAKVLASVYGGGEVASVGYGFYSYHEDNVIGEKPLSSASEAANTYVSISGDAVIGKDKDETNNIYYGGATMGNVYGGGSGNRTIVRCGLILGNTNVNVKGGTIYHNIYGGGAYGSVGDFEYKTEIDDEYSTKKVMGVESLKTAGTGTANVTITGGTIGVDGRENGMVFGSSRGDVLGNMQRDDYMAWVNEANVTIGTSGATTEPTIAGSVYGSGENGHTLSNTNVAIHSGTIGILTDSPITGSSGTVYNGAEYPYRGNVYGGGCGTDTYTEGGKTLYNPLAGIVMGNATVTMDGGRVARTIYGGGAMGSVGTFTYADATYHTEHTDVPVGKPYSCTEGTGLCTVTISGGSVGPDVLAMPHSYGNVFGAGRGEVHDPTEYTNLETSGYVNKTLVTVSGSAFVRGSVYGGAESGHVLADTYVKIEGGQIGCGKTTTKPYGDNVWAANYTPTDATYLECASWPYKAPYTPYDKFARADGTYSDGSSADNAHPTGTDGHTFYGNVFGGGSGYEPYAAGKWLPTAGWVEGNTTVEITGGHILTSVYGGNEMSDVGQGGVRKMTDLANETADMFYDITKPGGKCTVKMSGGTLGVPRTLKQIAAHPVTCYLFGAGKGDQRIFFNKITNVNNVEVEISGTARIYGSVFGGGEDGHVMRDVKMTIKDNAYIGNYGTSYVEGNVFGGGRGFSGEALTAGNVGGCVNIDIEGGTMLGSVYGGGRLGSVGHGLYLVNEELTIAGEKVKPYGTLRPDNQDDRGNTVENFERGNITINISGGTIGNDIEYTYNPTNEDKQKMPNTTFDYQNRVLYTKGGNVFAGCMGRLYSLDGKLLPLWPELGRCKNTVLNITGGHIKSNVYGGAELGVVQENTKVSITGGTIGTTVGTGEDAYVYGSAFGGGKGSNDAITYPDGTPEAKKVPISEAGTVIGNVEVELNKDVADSDNKKGGIVNKIFGCNDTNGTPKGTVTVHVYATQTPNTDKVNTKQGKDLGKYDVETIYGGGNLAAYNPDDADSKAATVIIDGCGLTSIETVYGGGNAASVPATEVTVNGTYEIGQAFGGGNGMDKLPTGADNPGANVGYLAYSSDSEKASKAYGTGKAHVTILGGTVHEVYGGSNTKGNVREESRATLKDGEECDFDVTDAYGGGNNALQDGNAILDVDCISGLGKAYGGASNADVNGNVILNITNGTYGQVFGGNDMGGCIRGSITVNVEETGCRPVIIGELYGGGNKAAYSVYGYNDDGTLKTSGDTVKSPEVNVRSFTSIGRIFGGGYGEEATMVGNPTVNINVVEGKYIYDNRTEIGDNAKVVGTRVMTGNADGYPIPSHTKGEKGAIQDVFGGGNAAKVIGNPTVNIGTEAGEEVYVEVKVPVNPVPESVENLYTRSGAGTSDSPYAYTKATGNAVSGTTYYLKTAKAVDIRGDVYGGGNNAEVTGDTKVVIGKKAE